MEPIFSRKLTAKFVPYNRTVPIFSRKLTAKFVPYNRKVPIFSRKLTAKFVPYSSIVIGATRSFFNKNDLLVSNYYTTPRCWNQIWKIKYRKSIANIENQIWKIKTENQKMEIEKT